jgi:hypothetical protein
VGGADARWHRAPSNKPQTDRDVEVFYVNFANRLLASSVELARCNSSDVVGFVAEGLRFSDANVRSKYEALLAYFATNGLADLAHRFRTAV